ncbi:MAG TPA: glycosyltransferase family 2 protein [Actinomycetales bacterium]|nr:glycosyltransferase family 2 protein [Actinomycetales bacterium]
MTGRGLVWVGTAMAVALTAHAAVNARLLRRPDDDPPRVSGRVSLLLPVRDEAHQVADCLTAVLAQTGVDDLEVLVLDDGSTDGTGGVVLAAAGDDPRVRLLGDDSEPPEGWLGKPWACHRLAEAATGDVLVFLDADVLLEPHALAAAVGQLRATGLDLVSPYPRQVAETPGERLVQPLLQWSWLTTLPLRAAERPGWPTLSAANGQLLVVDAEAYRRTGGHRAVRGEVLDDVALLRQVKTWGGRGVVTDGTAIATCRMYGSWAELRDGYSKSLWSAFGPPPAAAAVMAALTTAYVVPAAAALAGSPVGAVGFAVGVAGRVVVGRRTGARTWPDALAHPAGVLVLAALTARSHWLRRRGSLTWKGRSLA